jgi:3-hydroxy-9,10-secoandrosta-1,3,5(10)-triene-9,17-dione monooxygenase reductase component
MAGAHAMAAAAPRLEQPAVRAAFGRFATGVTFVSTTVDGTPLGLIVSTFTAVSLDPPLVSFCPARDSLTWRRMRQSGAFTIRVLGPQHARFARRAAEPGADRFAEPVRDPLAVLECDRVAEHVTGDHSIVVGRVRHLEVCVDSAPLVYFAGAFGAFHPEETPCPQT